jgi:hypothetical protein
MVMVVFVVIGVEARVFVEVRVVVAEVRVVVVVVRVVVVLVIGVLIQFTIKITLISQVTSFLQDSPTSRFTTSTELITATTARRYFIKGAVFIINAAAIAIVVIATLINNVSRYAATITTITTTTITTIYCG